MKVRIERNKLESNLWVIEESESGKVLDNAYSFKEAREKAIKWAKRTNKDITFYKISTCYIVTVSENSDC